MIPPAITRLADRRKWLLWIAAQPSPARFLRTAANGGEITLSVRTSEPAKSREMRLGGFIPTVELQCWVVLPIGALRPSPEKEFIAIVDLDQEYRTYAIEKATALLGTGCYQLLLKSRPSAPLSDPPAAAA